MADDNNNEVPPITVVSVLVPPRSWRSGWRASKDCVASRLIRFRRDRLRMVTSLMQPLLFLFVLGTGLSSLMGGTGAASVNQCSDVPVPGVLTLAVLFTAVFSAGSIVWDRRFGFLANARCPVGRWAIVVRKVCDGATGRNVPGLVLLALAGLVGVPYNPLMIVLVVAG